MYLNSFIWLSIFTIESLIFNQTCFPFVSLNFRLNKCDSHTKISDYSGNYLLALIKKSSHEESRFSPFFNLCPSHLSKFWITDSFCESNKSRYFEVLHEFAIKKCQQKFKICPLFTRCIKYKKATRKYLTLWNLLAISDKKNPDKFKFVLHSLCVLESH